MKKKKKIKTQATSAYLRFSRFHLKTVCTDSSMKGASRSHRQGLRASSLPALGGWGLGAARALWRRGRLGLADGRGAWAACAPAGAPYWPVAGFAHKYPVSLRLVTRQRVPWILSTSPPLANPVRRLDTNLASPIGMLSSSQISRTVMGCMRNLKRSRTFCALDIADPFPARVVPLIGRPH